MSGLFLTRGIVLGEGGDAPLAVTVRELTVEEIRTWLADIQAAPVGPIDMIDEMLLRDISLPDLMRMTSLTADQVAKLGPSKLKEVEAVVREINEAFFDLRARLLTVAAVIPSEILSAQSPA